MCKLFFPFIFTFICANVLCQTSDFEHPSKYWLYSYNYYEDYRPSGFADPDADNEVFCVGEMEKGGRNYQLACRVQGHHYQIPSQVDTLLYRNEGSRTYAEFDYMCKAFYDGDREALFKDYPYENGEVVLYDFSLSEGDTFGSTSVRDVSEITIGSEQRKMITMENGKRIVEGVGSLNIGFFEYMKSPLWLKGYNGVCSISLTSYMEGEVMVFQQSGEDAYGYLLTENEINEFMLNIIEINAMQAKDKYIHDMHGRRLAAPPTHGVYILKGRKYVK